MYGRDKRPHYQCHAITYVMSFFVEYETYAPMAHLRKITGSLGVKHQVTYSFEKNHWLTGRKAQSYLFI